MAEEVTIDEINSLQRRVEVLSREFFGKNQPPSCNEPFSTEQNYVKQLEIAQKFIKDSQQRYSWLSAYFKNIEENEELLKAHSELSDAFATDEMLNAKKQMIFLSENSVAHTTAEARKLAELQPFVDATSFQEIPKILPKLVEMASKLKTLQDTDCSSEVALLVDYYNKMVSTLSHHFALWDRILNVWEERLDKIEAMKAESV
eukprot:GCRY01003439.1.p1 GENE.GCRY01003439.1~~GCRY01003439.1.p1  ORF type:complete len:203 (+),score=42.94 GCRY01003439.1:215-823(+)